MMNYNHLYYFYMTAKVGGVSKAAEVLRISQPSLSAQLKTFERSLSATLFKKSGRRSVLTEQGQRLFVYATRMFDIAESLESSLGKKVDSDIQRIRIGVSSQVDSPFMADLLSPLLRDKGFSSRYIVSVSSSNDDELVHNLIHQKLDLVIGTKPHYQTEVDEVMQIDLPVHMMISEELLKRDRLKVSPRTTVGSLLKSFNWGLVLASERRRLRHEADIYMRENKLKHPIVFESELLSVVARAILDSAGVGFLPSAYVNEELRNGQLVRVGPKDGLWQHRLYLSVHKDNRLSEFTDAVSATLKLLAKT